MNITSIPAWNLLITATCATLVSISGSAQAGPDGLCGAFETVATPGQGEVGKVLTSIAVRGSSGFSLGRFYPQGSGGFVPLLYRYDGAEWVDQSLPPLSGPASDPVLMAAGMSAATGSTAWIVGWVTVPPPTNFLPLIARWRNGGFDRVETPQLRPQTIYPFDPRSGFANDVAVIADNDVWAVGQANGYGDAVTSSVAMALHWNGSSWRMGCSIRVTDLAPASASPRPSSVVRPVRLPVAARPLE